MQSADYWQQLFEGWPPSFPTKGVVVTTYQESIQFVRFMISDGMIVFERDKPDSSDARKVVIPFSSVAALKITETFELERFQELGFRSTNQD